MQQISDKIFNTGKIDYETTPLFLGSQAGLFDTVNKRYPEIWKLYKTMKSLDWDENEFNYSSCNTEFKTCPKSVYEMMIYTLGWQWESDTAAAKGLVAITSPFVSSSELSAAWSAVGTNEILHAATYSEIVRNSFDDPEAVLSGVLKVKESLNRLDSVAAVMAKTYEISHLYALDQVENNQETYNQIYMFVVAMLCLERIQFMASFAVTFCICDTGMFMPIGKAVQKIAQEELEVHAELDKAILTYENQTYRGKTAFIQCKDQIQKLLDDVTESELVWVDHLFSEGRELVGMSPELLKKWSLFNAKDVYSFFGLKCKHELPTKNPIKFMENWLNIAKTQASPQEQANGQYKLNIMQRNDTEAVFDVDF